MHEAPQDRCNERGKNEILWLNRGHMIGSTALKFEEMCCYNCDSWIQGETSEWPKEIGQIRITDQ